MNFVKKSIIATAFSGAFAAIALIGSAFAATAPTPAEALSATISAGTDAGTTKVTAVPDSGDFLVYQLSKTQAKVPTQETTVPATAIYYVPSTDIKVDLKTAKYVDIYEIDGTTFKVKKFKELEIGTNYTANLAPAINKLVIAPGTAPTTIKATATLGKGNKLKVFPGNVPVTYPPLIGSSVEGGIVYTLGQNIPLDPTNDNYIAFVELDGSGKAVAFTEVKVDNAIVTASALKEPTIAAGSKAGTTKLTATLSKSGNALVYQLAAKKPTVLPTIGSSLPAGTFPYTSGNDIRGVDTVKNKFLNVYEITDKGKVASYQSFELKQADISVPAVTVTSSTYGKKAGSTIFVLKAAAGGTFQIALTDSPISVLPQVGDSAPSGTTAYKSGTDLIIGNSKYIDVYELNKQSKIVGFAEIAMADYGKITAPVLASTVQSSVYTAGSAALTVNSGNTVYYAINSKATNVLPAVGTPISTSGKVLVTSTTQDLVAFLGDVNKFVDVYELDGNGNLLSFASIKLIATMFAPAPINFTIAPGLSEGSTKLTVVPAKAGNIFKFEVRSVGDPVPTIVRGALPPGSVNLVNSGSEIGTLDPITKKFIDLYELAGGKIVGYKQIILTSADIKGAVPVETEEPTGLCLL
ncbi:hypothetical protein [Cohnella faecalis]|uniref:S-layer protein SbsC C-terminal domain-containing protein n=1 Tax=Cohnella faecalis TaxID=2315694 RepID=A0A398CJK3_9BACL|nr:hypothetical protein [Cohnella faecalis]RIE02500.1 hypothetical protein D3H35_17570 [Cohnella faecalis]